MRTLSLRSTSLAPALASRSDAGTLILNSRFKPSERVSVTCMVSNLLLVRSRRACVGTLSLIDPARGERLNAGGSSDRLPADNIRAGADRVIRANAESAWCGRRDSNPHNFRHWNLNPARLPVPPRPRKFCIKTGRDAAGGGLIACARLFAAKKWPDRGRLQLGTTAGLIQHGVVRIGS